MEIGRSPATQKAWPVVYSLILHTSTPARVPMLRVRLLLLLLLLTPSVHASAVAKTPPKDKVAPVDPIVHVKLGESAVELAGPWKFHIGDDTAWAQPDFNDSGWENVDLTPDASTGLSPGWTARGHA